MTDLCNVNGDILPERAASVPILDRGFLFGDSVYEVMRTRDGVPFAWREHLRRLRGSANSIRLELDLDDAGLMRRVQDTIGATGEGERYVRIIVTRGTGSAPNIDLAYADGPPNTIILVRSLPTTQGRLSRLQVVPRLRTDPRALDPAIKSGNYLNNVLGQAEARAAGATDCLFLNADGFVTEASTANLFAFRGGRLESPPLSAGLLAGITRELLIRCAREAGIPIGEVDLSRDDVAAADELFLSSTLRDIAPVTHVDGQPVSRGAIGPRTAALAEEFGRFAARKVEQEDAPALRLLLGDDAGPLTGR